MTNPIPSHLRTVTPALVVEDAPAAIEFYKKAFGAEELGRFPGPDGTGVMHAEIRVGDSVVFVADLWPGQESTNSAIQLFVDDGDALFQRAVDAGADVTMPLSDMFWGDRFGQVRDPFGQRWAIATHKEDLSPEEIGRRAAEAMKQG